MNITGLDIGLIALVYFYVVVIFIAAEKLLKDRPTLSRKFVHIMVGNMIFVMPFFSEALVMILFITLPATIAVFFLTEYSPIKIENTVTDAGHALGLFYYALVWTILLVIFGVFSKNLWVVALGVGALVYGDGFASLIGAKFGRIKYKISGGEKSLEGSLSMFVVVGVMSVFIWMFYVAIGYPGIPKFNFTAILVISALAAIVEAVSPGEIDNVSVSGITVVAYYVLALISNISFLFFL